ncbi:MAG: lipase family protein [Terriglobales bacterium]
MRRTLPLTKFYDTSTALPAGGPGTLIRSEHTHDYYFPRDITIFRILYHSRTANGEDAATSGVVLVPDRKPPKGGWPVIAWAHRLEGVARTCAPSLVQNLHEGSFLSMYVNLGYAVVATDYAGLGTNYRNAAIDIGSNAADVIYSIPAARAAVPRLGARWIAMGAFEGALVALEVAEKEADLRDPNYLGSIAISGIADVHQLYQRLAQGPTGQMPVLLAYGIKTVFPQFRIEDMLTEKGLALYRRMETSCSLETDSPSEEMLNPHWEQDKFVQQFFQRNTLGQKTAFGPLLVISSEGDSAVPISLTAEAVGRLCKRGDHVQFDRYQSPNPKAVIGDSVRDQIEWIQGRFAGRTAPSNCP